MLGVWLGVLVQGGTINPNKKQGKLELKPDCGAGEWDEQPTRNTAPNPHAERDT